MSDATNIELPDRDDVTPGGQHPVQRLKEARAVGLGEALAPTPCTQRIGGAQIRQRRLDGLEGVADVARDEAHAALLQAHFGERLWLACELLQEGNDH